MTTIKEIEAYMEGRLPRTLSMPGDTDGTALCINGDKIVKTAVVALDVTLPAIEYAVKRGAQLLITHHPCIFGTVGAVTDGDATGKRLLAAVQAGVSLMSYHTRLDAADGGVNDSLCELIGVKPTGRFCGGFGRTASLAKPLNYGVFRHLVAAALGAENVTGIDCGRPVQRLAVVGGSGKSMLYDAIATGADTYLTGEVAHNTLIDARDMGINLLCATHYRTERPVVPVLHRMINEGFPDIEVLEYYDTEL